MTAPTTGMTAIDGMEMSMETELVELAGDQPGRPEGVTPAWAITSDLYREKCFAKMLGTPSARSVPLFMSVPLQVSVMLSPYNTRSSPWRWMRANTHQRSVGRGSIQCEALPAELLCYAPSGCRMLL